MQIGLPSKHIYPFKFKLMSTSYVTILTGFGICSNRLHLWHENLFRLALVAGYTAYSINRHIPMAEQKA